jgi:hypothetical protein
MEATAMKQNSSSAAIVKISRDKKRYLERDQLLAGFQGRDGFTAKEVANEGLGWTLEPYSNAPKRAKDLEDLGYIEQTGQKVCRLTGKEAHSFRITAAGLEHLKKIGMSGRFMPEGVGDQAPAADPVQVQDKGARFAGLRDSLGK